MAQGWNSEPLETGTKFTKRTEEKTFYETWRDLGLAYDGLFRAMFIDSWFGQVLKRFLVFLTRIVRRLTPNA